MRKIATFLALCLLAIPTRPQVIVHKYRNAVLPETAFVTVFSLGVARSDFTGGLGFRMTVGGSDVTVSSLGRDCRLGNSGSHLIRIVRNADQVVVASATVNLSGCTAGVPVYTAITPVTLTAATVYNVASDELTSGDTWADEGLITTTGVATVTNSVYESAPNTFSTSSGAGYSFSEPTFKYQ